MCPCALLFTGFSASAKESSVVAVSRLSSAIQLPSDRKSRRDDTAVDVIWLCCFAIASSIWCLTAAARLGPTFDEPSYLRWGLEHWQTGSYKSMMREGAMPLAIDLQTLPVYLSEHWRGASMPFAVSLQYARAVTLFFWWALLIYAMRAGRAIAGPWAGRITVALIACEPVLLGHAALATSDIAVTACLLALTVEFYRGRERRWIRRVMLPAVLLGVAILAKASALVFGPLCLLTIDTCRIYSHPDSLGQGETRDQCIKRSALDWMWILIGGVLVTFLYCGSDWKTEPTFIEWAQTLPAGKMQGAMLWISEHLRIFTNAGEGLVQQIKHNIRGHNAFILGHAYRRAVWFYFPTALTMKLTLTLLGSVAVIAAVRRQALRNWACAVAAVLLVYSLMCRVQIGVRLMLPLVVFLCVGVGAAAAVALRDSRGVERTLLVAWFVFAIPCSAFASLSVWPHGICFTNKLWGGTTNGYRMLSDSNYDWGQGLPDLRQWQRQHGVTEMHVWYFGTDPSVNEPPLRELPLHRVVDQSVVEATQGKIVAVSMTLLYGAYTISPGRAQEAAAFFQKLHPIDRTMTFLIYDLRDAARETSLSRRLLSTANCNSFATAPATAQDNSCQ